MVNHTVPVKNATVGVQLRWPKVSQITFDCSQATRSLTAKPTSRIPVLFKAFLSRALRRGIVHWNVAFSSTIQMVHAPSRETHCRSVVFDIHAWVRWSVAPVCECPRLKRKRLELQHGRHTVRGSCSACIDPEIKRSKVKATVVSFPGPARL